MKNFSKAGAALLVAAVFVFASCETGAETGVITIGGLSVDTANHHGSAAAFRVRNDTNLLLVAFRNSVHPNNLLGGIPENAQNHGIRDDRALLIPNADAFPVILITREQLEAHSGNWSHLNQNPFSRIFVFYNRNAEPGFPAEVYTISGHLGGNYRLTIMNPTNHNWEIRLGGTARPYIRLCNKRHAGSYAAHGRRPAPFLSCHSIFQSCSWQTEHDLPSRLRRPAVVHRPAY